MGIGDRACNQDTIMRFIDQAAADIPSFRRRNMSSASRFFKIAGEVAKRLGDETTSESSKATTGSRRMRHPNGMGIAEAILKATGKTKEPEIRPPRHKLRAAGLFFCFFF